VQTIRIHADRAERIAIGHPSLPHRCRRALHYPSENGASGRVFIDLTESEYEALGSAVSGEEYHTWEDIQAAQERAWGTVRRADNTLESNRIQAPDRDYTTGVSFTTDINSDIVQQIRESFNVGSVSDE
jgi:hypothetical protein